jgi:hypothetical protein
VQYIHLFSMFRHKKEYSLINLDRIQTLIDSGRIDSSKPITVESLYKAGIKNLQDGVKILARVTSHFGVGNVTPSDTIVL